MKIIKNLLASCGRCASVILARPAKQKSPVLARCLALDFELEISRESTPLEATDFLFREKPEPPSDNPACHIPFFAKIAEAFLEAPLAEKKCGLIFSRTGRARPFLLRSRRKMAAK